MQVNTVDRSEYADFYAGYLAQVSAEYPLVEELEIALHRLIHFVRDIPMDKFDYRYAEGKWTIKDILQHLLDSERVFAYRALCIARQDQTAFPGFDEDFYVANAQANQRSIQELLTEFTALRQATLCLFKSFTSEALQSRGTASGHPVSVRALGFMIIGHQNHHVNVFQQRYL